MLRTIEATIDQSGKVKLAEPIRLASKTRALVTILDETLGEAELPNEAALLSEPALAKDWLTEQEDKAWAHLADLPDLDKKRGRSSRK